MDDIRLKLKVFEGPLDLLLHLVKINEVDIYDIPIAEITKQYLEYLRLMESLDLEIAGDFLVMASTLVNIKLRSLLPETTLEEDEQEEDEGSILTAQALLKQLVEYRKFKEAAAQLQDREEQQSQIFFREVALPQLAHAEGEDEIRVDLDKLLIAFSRVLRFVEARGWHMVTDEEYAVEDKIEYLQERLKLENKVDVEQIFQNCRSKLEMIVVLLALLELCRQKWVTIEQDEVYGSVQAHAREESERLAPPVPEMAEAEAAAPRPTAQIVEFAAETDDDEDDDEDPED